MIVRGIHFHRTAVILAGLTCSILGGSSVASGQTTFGGDARLGTCTHFAQGWDYQKLMPLIEKSGLGWIRDDIGWESVESGEKGKYHVPERTMAWIRAAHENHLRVLAILNGGNKLYADRYDPQAFARWAGWMAKELAGEVDAVEILNEPNNFGFSKYYGGQHEGEGDSPWVAKYVTLMNAAADAIKTANPKMPVIGFGAGAPVTYKQLSLGTSSAVDAIADHPYSNHSVPELIPAKASEQMKHFGFAMVDERGTFASLVEGFRTQSRIFHGPRGIWLTEWGFSTYQPLTAGQFSGFTETAQAKYILRRFAEGLGLGVEASFLYDFRDDGGNDPASEHNAEARWGLVRSDGTPKPSFQAVANFSKLMAGYQADLDGKAQAVNVFPAASSPDQSPIATYRLVDRQNRPALLIWATDRADGDLQPRIADVEWLKDDAVQEIEAVDILTGKIEPVVFKRAGNGTKGKRMYSRFLKEAMTVHDYPVLLREKSSTAGEAPIATTAKPGTIAPQNDAPKDLDIFNKKTKWTFFNGQEFPGATGSFALASDSDKQVGEIGYDFTKGGNYVSAETSIAVSDRAAELRFGVRADRALGLSVRLIDHTGQCHQFAKAYSGTGSWETIRVAFDRPASEHWGGANDGKLHFPIKTICFCVGKPSGKPLSGKAEFADALIVPK